MSNKELVLGYLEKVNSKVFSDFPKEITSLVDGKHGVYALYKRDRLYYVGLATNLKNRVKHHLKDRHEGKWDSFSLYLVRKSDHIKELESLILRIADPKGNKVKGRLPNADNMSQTLKSRIKNRQEKSLNIVLNLSHRPSAGKPVHKSIREKKISGRPPTLAPYAGKRFELQKVYKGKTYMASVLTDGTVVYNGQRFSSPSLAAATAIGRAVNGWWFWRYKNDEGKWVKLDALRKDRD